MLIVWDYFGVIAQDAFWYTAVRIAEGRKTGDLVAELHDEVNLGKITWDEYCQAVASDIGVPYEEVVDRYQHHQIKEQTILAIKHLPEHDHVLLSNAAHTYLIPIMDRLGLHKLFERTFVSSELGYAKPDKRAFEAVLKAMNVPASGAIMVDDSSRNIDAAAALGMKTVLFSDALKIGEEITRLVA